MLVKWKTNFEIPEVEFRFIFVEEVDWYGRNTRLTQWATAVASGSWEKEGELSSVITPGRAWHVLGMEKHWLSIFPGAAGTAEDVTAVLPVGSKRCICAAQRAWPAVSGHPKERTKPSGLCGYLGVSRGWLAFHWLRCLLTSNFAILSNSNTKLHLCLNPNYRTNNKKVASFSFYLRSKGGS